MTLPHDEQSQLMKIDVKCEACLSKEPLDPSCYYSIHSLCVQFLLELDTSRLRNFETVFLCVSLDVCRCRTRGFSRYYWSHSPPLAKTGVSNPQKTTKWRRKANSYARYAADGAPFIGLCSVHCFCIWLWTSQTSVTPSCYLTRCARLVPLAALYRAPIPLPFIIVIVKSLTSLGKSP